MEPSDGYVRLYQIRDYGNSPVPVYIKSEYAKKTTKEGDILLARYGASLGKVFLAHQGAYNVAMAKVIPLFISNWIDKDFLFYYYHTSLYRDTILGNARCAQAGFNKEDLISLLFPIPPLAEQRRIVSKIETLLPLVESYGERQVELDDLNATFPEALKKSILQEAIQGRLVEQDPNDEPASVLLERIRKEKERLIKLGKIKRDKKESVIYRRSNSLYVERVDDQLVSIDDGIPFDIPESWEWVRWGTLSESIQYGYNAPAKDCGNAKMVRISDIQDNSVQWNDVPSCDIPEDKLQTYLLQKNDILFARTGGTVGKSYLVSSVPGDYIYAGYLIRTRFIRPLCFEYIKYFMESALYWQQLKEGTTATAQPNCNGKTLAKMLMPLPPLKEQYRIVAVLDSSLDQVATL